MRLPDFIKRAVAFFENTEAKLAKLEPKALDPDNDGDEHCDACAGSGKCDACEGAGKMDGAECAECEGSGKCAECEGQGTAKAQVSALKSSVASFSKLVTEQGVNLAATKSLLDAKTAELAKLTDQLATEKRRANETIAAQGISPGQVPAAEPTGGSLANGENAWQKYCRLMTENPRAAGEFYRTSAEAILAARPK